ncbi:YcaO-like family protein [Streptomyces sp. NPDC047014]|uniref:YcaO-like family protein n=1 Tax=Streptomyces sp. NPDC047014 TaxID=3155736 RepID=UPI0033D98DA2
MATASGDRTAPAGPAGPAAPAQPGDGPPPDAGAHLVRQVTLDRPRVPTVPSCVSYTARLAADPARDPAAVDTVTGGAALGHDHERARRAATGEAVERYCANLVPDGLPIAPYGGLSGTHRDAVDPRTFALYSPGQYAQRGFPFVPMTRELPIAWTAGQDLDSGRETWVPASIAYVNYHRGARRTQPPTHYPLLAGTAAGPSPEEARLAALREVLERDAVTLWWLGGAPATALEPPYGDQVAAALEEAAASGLRVTLLRIPSTLDVTVVGAFIEDRARRIVAFGSACRETAGAAAAKALTEAIGTHETSLELLDADSGFWRAVRQGHVDRRPYRAHRADRAYRAAFRRDWHDVNDVRLHLQAYLDPRMQDDTRLDRLRNPRPPQDGQPPCAADGPAPDLAGYVRLLAAQGLRAVAVDLAPEPVRAAGVHVARVLVPGLYCNAPAAFPFLGGRRLYRGPAPVGGPVLDPLPFS